MISIFLAAALLDPSKALIDASSIYGQSSLLQVGVEPKTYKMAIDHVWAEQAKDSQRPWQDMSPADVAKLSSRVADDAITVLKQHYGADVTQAGKELLRAEALSAWVTLWLTRNTDIDSRLARGENVDTVASASPRITFSTNPPKAVCAGYALVFRDAARNMGLVSVVLQGRLRTLTGGEGGHCWAAIRIGESCWLPVDPTTPVTRQEVVRARGKLRAYGLLPRSREELTVYHARYYNWSPVPSTIAMYGDPSESLSLTRLTEAQWRTIDTSGLQGLENRLYRQE